MSSNHIITSLSRGVRMIKFNRPTRKNAFILDTYLRLTDILNSDATNDAVVVTTVTGEGEYYSSGNDFSLSSTDNTDYDVLVDKTLQATKDFVKALIDYPKLLVAVVNGPAIGLATTTLALFDVVYASERATFSTPFAKLALVPEACSSYLFPRLMGRSVASEMLILGRQLTAHEAFRFGLVSEVIPHDKLSQLFQKLHKHGDLPVKVVKNIKELILMDMKDKLHKINKHECDMLNKCFYTAEFLEAVTKFANRKSKL